MDQYLLRAYGEDRPGIVYRITDELAKLNCNLSDSTMTDLEGQFVIMLSFSRELESTSALLEEHLCQRLKDLSLAIDVSPINSRNLVPSVECTQIAIRVFGADRMGIVAGITKVLYDFEINIVNLRTSGTRSSTESGTLSNYLLLIVAEGQADLDVALIESKLTSIAGALGVHMSLDVVRADTI